MMLQAARSSSRPIGGMCVTTWRAASAAGACSASAKSCFALRIHIGPDCGCSGQAIAKRIALSMLCRCQAARSGPASAASWRSRATSPA